MKYKKDGKEHIAVKTINLNDGTIIGVFEGSRGHNPDHDILINIGVICKVSVEDPFVAVSDLDLLPPFKAVRVKFTGKQAFLENSNSNKIPVGHI